MQVTVQEHANHGLTFLAAYTLAHANADGCNLGASCESQNPYDRHSDYGTSDLNEKNVFSVAFTAASPYDRSPNKLLANVAGGWALNGIVQETSGQPYQVNAGGDPLNVGCCLTERMNVSGNPNVSGPHTLKEWFNTSAFTAAHQLHLRQRKGEFAHRFATFQRRGYVAVPRFPHRARRGAILRVPSRIVQPLQ